MKGYTTKLSSQCCWLQPSIVYQATITRQDKYTTETSVNLTENDFKRRYRNNTAPGGGGTPIHKLYGDVPPFRVWFFDRLLINRVSNSKISEDFL